MGARSNGSRLSCGRLARRRKGEGRQSVPRQGHNTPLPLERSAPASFTRLLGGKLMVLYRKSSRPAQPEGSVFSPMAHRSEGNLVAALKSVRTPTNSTYRLTRNRLGVRSMERTPAATSRPNVRLATDRRRLRSPTRRGGQAGTVVG